VELRLVRHESGDQGTVGAILAGELPLCYTLEPPWRDNRPNRSCIPSGRYLVISHRSPRFGHVYLVTDVPGRSHILFHAGNFGGDVDLGYRTHTQGCILPGSRQGRLAADGRLQRAVLASRMATRQLFSRLGNEPFVLTVEAA